MVRYIVEEDRDLFLSMEKEFYSSSAVDHQVEENNFINTFNEALNDSPYVKIIVSERENDIVGYALLAITYSNEVGGEVVWIEEMYIKDYCRNQGIGADLFAFIESEFPRAKRIRLEVREDNQRAIELYKRLGYERLCYSQMVKDR